MYVKWKLFDYSTIVHVQIKRLGEKASLLVAQIRGSNLYLKDNEIKLKELETIVTEMKLKEQFYMEIAANIKDVNFNPSTEMAALLYNINQQYEMEDLGL